MKTWELLFGIAWCWAIANFVEAWIITGDRLPKIK